MITKVFFTMLVIVIVGMIFRSKNQSQQVQRRSTSEQTEAQAAKGSIAPKAVAYLLVGLLIIVSGVLYYFNWSDANQLVTLRVINAGGGLSEYQAYQKDIRGREFTSIGGVLIQLADTDRLEMLIQQ